MATGNGNIDERLEAVTMNLELMSASVEAHDRQLATIMDAIEAHDRQITTIIGALEKLVKVAETHDRRIADLEGGGRP
jgi:DNA repair ATPase RecN